MLEIATITAIIGALSSAVGLVDKVTDSFIKYRTGHGDSIGKEHRMKITKSPDGESLIALEHGREMQRISYEQLSDKLARIIHGAP